MSIAGGVHLALERGAELGCSTIQIFVKNARSWRSKAYTQEVIANFAENQRKTGIAPVVAHSIYLVNLATEARELRERSIDDMRDEMSKCDQLNIPYLVLHPGTHQNEKIGLRLVAEALDELYSERFRVSVTLETTAGQGNNLGFRFEQIAEIIELAECGKNLSVCFDTCHVFAAGYELRTESGYERTFEEFNSIIGIEKLKVIHLNDSKYPLGSRRDRHEHIGKGELGLSAFSFIMNDKRFVGIPKILETPKGGGTEFDRMNIETLLKLVKA